MFSMKKKNIQGSINTLDVILKSEKKNVSFFFRQIRNFQRL